jgi:hypothetical protein
LNIKNQLTMKKIYFLVASIIISTTAFSQNIGINATGAAPNASAMLDVSATNKGVLIPRVALSSTTSNAPIGGGIAASLLVYNTATAGSGSTAVYPGYYYWDGSKWVALGGSGGKDWSLLGNAGTTAGTNFLGTTDAQALDFRTNNTIRFRIANGYQALAYGNGSAGAPFYSWNSDTDIGMYRITTNTLGFSTAGVERMRITSNGDVGVNGVPNIGDKFVSFVNFGTAWSINGYNVSDGSAGYFNTNGNNSNNYSTIEVDQQNNSSGAGLDVEHWGNNNNRFGIIVSTGANNDMAGIYNNDNEIALNYFVISDKRLKTNINKIENAIGIIEKLNPVSYKFNTKEYSSFKYKGLNYGFLAQEVQKVLPELVAENSVIDPKVFSNNSKKGIKYTDDDIKYHAVNYVALIPILTKAIKEQQQIINDQQKQIDELKELVNKLYENK